MADNTLLNVEELKVYFYTYAGVVKAVDGVSFDVRRGEVFSIVGETGSGKSVTSRALTRLIPSPGRIVGGRILFEGKNLLEMPEEELRKIRGKDIAYIFQDPSSSLDPLFTSGYQIAETMTVHATADWKNAWKRVIEILKDVAMPDPHKRAKSYPHELSGGMKQRVVIGISVSNKPKLIIADEPTTALDVSVQAQILKLLLDLRKKYDTTVMLITHNLGVVAEVSDRVLVMYAGRVAEIADVYSLFGEPLHPYTIGLLKAVPNPLKRIERIEPIPGSVPDMINVPSGCRFHPRCPKAMDICKREQPPLVQIRGGRSVACWLYAEKNS